jgi:hypothetical protein
MAIIGFDTGLADDGRIQCFECGLEAAAFWSGNFNVGVCRDCAVEVLPMLIADAIASPNPKRPAIRAAFADAAKRIDAAFWKGACLAVARGNDAQGATS